MSEDLKGSSYYGTFQGVPHPHPHPPPPPPPQHTAIGFPQPAASPGATSQSHYYAHGYQPLTGYVVAEGTPVPVRRRRPLPCCGCGIGWFLFIIGFFLGAIPWYLATFIMLFSRIDRREKPGYIACTVAAILATIAIIIGATNDDWYDW